MLDTRRPTGGARIKLMVIIGTRPEAIKLAPVIIEARARAAVFDVCIVRTGQHREMADQAMAEFGLHADVNLNLMRPGQSLADLSAACVAGLAPVIERHRPDWVLVQGDTTTTFAGALAAAYQQVRVAHVEAGLRTGRRDSPFPEEINRCLTAQLSALHFAPTQAAKLNLLREGVAPECIAVTGNTGVDALFQILRCAPPPAIPMAPGLLVTLHRRESLGERMAAVCDAVLDLLDTHPALTAVLPMHPNPKVRETLLPKLRHHARVQLIEPLGYRDFVHAMHCSTLILTDSAGVLEEAPSLGKPVLVLRELTERLEAVDAGAAVVVGTDRHRIVAAASRLLDDEQAYAGMACVTNPFGDGQAARRILDGIARSSGESRSATAPGVPA